MPVFKERNRKFLWQKVFTYHGYGTDVTSAATSGAFEVTGLNISLVQIGRSMELLFDNEQTTKRSSIIM